MKRHLAAMMAFLAVAAALAACMLAVNRFGSGPGAVAILLLAPHENLAAARNRILSDPSVRLLNPGPWERLMIVHVESMSAYRQSSGSGAVHAYLGMLRVRALGCV